MLCYLNTTEEPSLSTSTPILPSTSLVMIQQHQAGLPTPKNCLISSEQDLAQAKSTASRFQIVGKHNFGVIGLLSMDYYARPVINEKHFSGRG